MVEMNKTALIEELNENIKIWFEKAKELEKKYIQTFENIKKTIIFKCQTSDTIQSIFNEIYAQQVQIDNF
jgi:hypothetical protein